MKIFLDFDSTLVDLHNAWITWLKNEKLIRIRPQDILNWNWVSDKFGEEANNYWRTEGIYARDVKPIAGSQLFIKTLNKIYGKDNLFIISNSARNMILEKTEYARNNFDVHINNFLHVEDKWKYTVDGVLIDDAPHNVINHSVNNNRPSILFNYRNSYGWAKLDNPHKLISTCIDYSECLVKLEKYKKLFKEE